MRIESITSAKNPKIKDLLSLQEKSKLRKERGLFSVEGRRELGHCMDSGFVAETLFFCDKIISSGDMEQLMKQAFSLNESCLIVEVTPEIYEKIAWRGGTEGVIGLMRMKDCSLEKLRLKENPLVIVLEGVEKPGNIGAILRSADAAGADAVILCDPLADVYNPNLIRASIGAVFTVNVACASSEEAINWLKQNNISILTAQLQDSLPYYDTDMTKGTAIVMGTESVGLSDQWRKAADKHIRIPMLGDLDSLNVSVSAAILLFEGVRQRSIRA